MSRKYRYKSSNMINIVFAAIILLTVPFAIPVFVVATAILYVLDLNILSNIVIMILCALPTGLLSGIQHALGEMCFNKVVTVFFSAIECLSNYNIIGLFNIYKIYTFLDWIIISLLTLIMSVIYVLIIKENREKEQAGVIGFNAQIKKSQKKKIKQTTEKSTFVGYSVENKKVYLPDDSKHAFIAGTTGAGKTVLLSNFVKSAIKSNYGALIIDGKGDVGDNTLLDITRKLCETENRKLYVIDMNDYKNSNKYNPFVSDNETIIKDMFINLTDWSEEHYKANTERYIQRVIQMMSLENKKFSFHRIIDTLSPDKFKELSSNLVKKEKITKEQHTKNLELIESSGKIAKDASARFSTIAESPIGKIFSKNGIDITAALKEKAVIIFVLNPLLYPETSKIMGRLILIDSKKAVSNLFNTPERKFFIFDEINVYASMVFLDLINKSRSANVTCFCASQSLSDLESAVDESFKHQIIENCNNYFIMRQNSFKSAEECAKLIGTSEKLKLTYQLSETESTGKGSARRTREFIVHPDEIKSQAMGECVFVSRDNGICERIKVNKPF